MSICLIGLIRLIKKQWLKTNRPLRPNGHLP